jgi:diguanylate cyclase (GGDEF)-like protein
MSLPQSQNDNEDPQSAAAAAHDRQARAMDRLLTAVQELSFARTLNDIQRIVRTAAREMTGCDGATFVLNDDDIYCHYADEDAIAPLWKGLRFPQETCISGWVMRNRKPALIADIYVDPRIPKDAYRPTFVKSLAMVPIRTMRPIGAIGNYWAEQHQPTAFEVRLLQALADSTSVAMENLRISAEIDQRVDDRTIQLQKANSEIRTLSGTDELTGLRNRRGFHEAAEAACLAGDRLLVAFIDVDGLKNVNDTMGHAMGDALLVDVAHALRACFRHDDILARLSGDEFCVLVRNPTIDAAGLQALFNARLHELNQSLGRNYAISASIGVVDAICETPLQLSGLITKADELMYIDKKARKLARY